MANSKKNNLKGMSRAELEKELKTRTESLRSVHFKAEGSRSKNVEEYGTIRRQIARILTELHKK